MSARLLTGKEPAELLLEELRPLVATLNPKLAIVQIGDDPSSETYIKRKLKSCASIGMRAAHRRLPSQTTVEEAEHLLLSLNADEDVSGILLQLPLPNHLWEERHRLLSLIDPKKDVDGLSARNLGHLFASASPTSLMPATPSGILLLLAHYDIGVQGQRAVVVGRSNVVGKPLALLLLQQDATVTVCHSRTKDLSAATKEADLLVSAVGKAGIITADMVKPGAVVIDVGITRTDEGLIGDVDAPAVSEVASALSPVPGGVGPLTVACLLRNCVLAKQLQTQ